MAKGWSEEHDQHHTLADFVYHKLNTSISHGELALHDRLPSEHVLAQTYGVSRPVVRQALQRLRDDGLIYSQKGSGSFVRIAAETAVVGFEPLSTIADIQRCYEFRISVESDCAYHAAMRANSDAVAAVEQAHKELGQAAKRNRYHDEADYAFHAAVAAAANNSYYARVVAALQAHIGVGVKIGGAHLMGAEPSIFMVVEEHARILDAIAEGKPDAAKAAMIRHINAARNRVFEGKLFDLALP